MKLEKDEIELIPRHQIIFGEIIKWTTIASCLIAMIAPVIGLAFPENNILQPNRIFALIFAGNNKDVIWAEAGSGFPGGHFYLQNMFTGDGFAQFGVALGCSVALWALLPTIISYFKSKEYLCAFVSIFIALIIILAMTGLISVDA